MRRREFLARSGMARGAMTLASARSVRAAPANDALTLAIVGVRGRGAALGQGFIERGDCRVVYVCDVNLDIANSRAGEFAQRQNGKSPKVVQDFRRALDDKSVDAVVVATPDHWHCPATVWACQAGKDVYVEKPLGHNAWEGRRAVEAARKYKRIVEVGLQNRSAAYNHSAKKFLSEGKLGRIHLCRVFNQKLWPRVEPKPDSQPPKGFDWDMFNGPAPESPYNVNYVNHWHNFWQYSGGDIINDGVHQLDLARWVMDVKYPKSVYCAGGQFDPQTAEQTPQVQLATFEFDRLFMTFEMTLYTPYMLKTSPATRESLTEYPYWPQNASRIEIYGSEGLMCVGRHGGGWQVFVRTKDEKPVIAQQDNGRFPDPEHKEDFVRAVRGRRAPNADVEEGHLSTLLAQYANVSLRLGGRKLPVDPATEQFVGDAEANGLLRRKYRKPYEVPEIV